MTGPDHPQSTPRNTGPTVEELFGTTEPFRSPADLARDGVFDDGEVEEFLADLYAMRRPDLC